MAKLELRSQCPVYAIFNTIQCVLVQYTQSCPLCVENILIVSAESTNLFSIGLHRTLFKPCFFPGAQTSVGRNSTSLIIVLNIFLQNIKQTGALGRKATTVKVNFQYERISQCYKRPLMRKGTVKIKCINKIWSSTGQFPLFQCSTALVYHSSLIVFPKANSL